MHELAVVEGLVRAVEARADGGRVTVVRLDVGRLTCVSPDALSFCFDVAVQGTALAGARLEIRPIDGLARCRACGVEGPITGAFEACPCGSFDRRIVKGEELRLREFEVL